MESQAHTSRSYQQHRALAVLCTCPSSSVAEQVANELVDNQIAACVNIIPGVKSVYRWQGKIAQDEEIMLVIKTTGRRFEAVRECIRRVHPYELPEVIGVSIEQGDEAYLKWIEESVR